MHKVFLTRMFRHFVVPMELEEEHVKSKKFSHKTLKQMNILWAYEKHDLLV